MHRKIDRKEYIMAMVATIPPQTAQMVINLSDALVANDVRRLLKHVKGVESISIKKKNGVEMSLEEAHAGQVTTWNSVSDYFKNCL